MKRVFLLNPPGRRIYIRDYYCSKVSKTNYIYHPVDLTFQSAVLSEQFHVFVLDAMAEKMSVEATLRYVASQSPDVVLCLIGAASWEEDRLFVEELRKTYRGKIALMGDVFLEKPSEILDRIPSADAALLDFTSRGFAEWALDFNSAPKDMIVKKRNGYVENVRSPYAEEFSIGIPLYNLFPNKLYKYPFVRRRPFATVLTDYGCPFKCSFCIMGKLGYRLRPVDEVMEEFRYLKKEGFRELYINDQTFGANRARTLRLLSRMIESDLNFGWVCFTRFDVLDEELIQAMKKAGCHTVMLGVESADSNLLKIYRKGMTTESARKGMELCKRFGLRTVATFLLGLPEDDDSTIEATIKLALELDPDYASFNFAAPRRGTDVRTNALKNGLIDADVVSMDQAGDTIAMPTKTLPKERIAAWRKEAYRRFYMRPRYLLKRMLSLKTAYELNVSVEEGFQVLKNALGFKD